ncbi:MAG: PA14 domain-containing protein [Myxococcota bacterium]|nr:PA14 domain-containing protein [Myxococcota bacterium]
MLRWLFPCMLGACSFAVTPGEGLEIRRTIVADSAAELSSGVLTGGVVSPRGVIEPDSFVLGGLHARAFAGELVDDDDSYEEVEIKAAAAPARGAAYRQLLVNWGGDRPRGLGLLASADYTLLYDGEILLPAGPVRLEVTADDRAFVQIALDRAAPGTFGAPLRAQNATETLELTVGDAGWYPIRAAYAQASGGASLQLTLVDGPVRTAVGPERLRARVTDSPGLMVFGFDGQGFVLDRGATTRPTIDDAFQLNAPPFDLGMQGDRFSLRYAGQLRIDTAGSYTFTANVGGDASDGWRLWLDGAPVAYRWGGVPDLASVTLDLDAGWHDILVDYADETGNAEIEIGMTGPDAPDGGVIDPAHLRPAVKFGNTFTFLQPATTSILDLMSTLVPLPLPGTALTVIDSVDYGFRIDNQDMAALEVVLFDCTAGKPLPLRETPGYHYYAADRSCAGKATMPAFPWSLRITDKVSGNAPFAGTGVLREYGISALYHGGDRMPFAPVVVYDSASAPTPGALRIDDLRVVGAFDGAAVELAIRTGRDPDSLAAAAWVVVADGELPDVEASELVQYRIVLTTNGWQFPQLDKVEIGYAVAAEQD